LLNQVGCEARKNPAGGDVFFLDFYLYRTFQYQSGECDHFGLAEDTGVIFLA
jgi:hypothetical protein